MSAIVRDIYGGAVHVHTPVVNEAARGIMGIGQAAVAHSDISYETLSLAVSPNNIIDSEYANLEYLLSNAGIPGPYERLREDYTLTNIVHLTVRRRAMTGNAVSSNYSGTVSWGSLATAGWAYVTGLSYTTATAYITTNTTTNTANPYYIPTLTSNYVPDIAEPSQSTERSLELLYHNLTDAQRQQYIDKKYIEVIGQRSKSVYRIFRARSSNVLQLHKDGSPRARFCLSLADGAPVYDLMLAEKMLIETDEHRFLKTANRFPSD